jgi:hypothetical protein
MFILEHKEELICAALKHHDVEFRKSFTAQIEKAKGTPADKLEAIFDVADAFFRKDNFFGCMFINVIGEYSSRDSQIRDICKESKKLVWSYISN